MWFLQVSPKSSWSTFKTIFKTLSALGACHVTIIGGKVYKKSMIFEVFWECLGEFLIFVREIFLVARSYLVCCDNIKSLIKGAPVTLEMRIKFPILAVFWRFWLFFELFVLAHAFSLGHWFFTKIGSMYILSHLGRDFFMKASFEPIINTMQTKFS